MELVEDLAVEFVELVTIATNPVIRLVIVLKDPKFVTTATKPAIFLEIAQNPQRARLVTVAERLDISPGNVLNKKVPVALNKVVECAAPDLIATNVARLVTLPVTAP